MVVGQVLGENKVGKGQDVLGGMEVEGYRSTDWWRKTSL